MEKSESLSCSELPQWESYSSFISIPTPMSLLYCLLIQIQMLFGTILEIFCLLKKFVSTVLAAHSIRELMCTSEVSERLIGRICPEISSQVSGLRSLIFLSILFFAMVVFLHSKDFGN